MRNVSSSRKWCAIKYKLLDCFKENKKTTFFLVIFILLGILTGIFTAIRYSRGASLICFNDFSISQYLSGDLGTLDLFLSRLFSTSICCVIVLVCSTTIYLSPVIFILLTYRAYLVSLNISIIVIVNGLGGIASGLLIVLPCQLLGLIVLAFFCSCAIRRALLKKRYGTTCKIWDKFLLTFFVLLILNAIETFLLYIFSSKVILVL